MWRRGWLLIVMTVAGLAAAACGTSAPGPGSSARTTTTSSTSTTSSTTTSTSTTMLPTTTSSTTTTAAALDWVSPQRVQSGVPVHVASISPCPAAPTAGDSVQVMITLGQGASNQLLQADKDGSWSGDVTFSFSALPNPTTISASCRDFFGNGSNPYADYQTRSVEVSS